VPRTRLSDIITGEVLVPSSTLELPVEIYGSNPLTLPETYRVGVALAKIATLGRISDASARRWTERWFAPVWEVRATLQAEFLDRHPGTPEQTALRARGIAAIRRATAIGFIAGGIAAALAIAFFFPSLSSISTPRAILLAVGAVAIALAAGAALGAVFNVVVHAAYNRANPTAVLTIQEGGGSRAPPTVAQMRQRIAADLEYYDRAIAGRTNLTAADLEPFLPWQEAIRDTGFQPSARLEEEIFYWAKMAAARAEFLRYWDAFLADEPYQGQTGWPALKTALSRMHAAGFYLPPRSVTGMPTPAGVFRTTGSSLSRPFGLADLLGIAGDAAAAGVSNDPAVQQIERFLRYAFSVDHAEAESELAVAARRGVSPAYLAGWQAFALDVAEGRTDFTEHPFLEAPAPLELARVRRLAGADRPGLLPTVHGSGYAYPAPDAIDSYVQAMYESAVEIRAALKAGRPAVATVPALAEMYQIGINAHFFPIVNNSILMVAANAQLRLAGLSGVPHQRIDYAALMTSPPTFSRTFTMKVADENPASAAALLASAGIRSPPLTLPSTYRIGRFLFGTLGRQSEQRAKRLSQLALAPVIEIPATLGSGFLGRHAGTANQRAGLRAIRIATVVGLVIGAVVAAVAVAVFAPGVFSVSQSGFRPLIEAALLVLGSAVGTGAVLNAAVHFRFNLLNPDEALTLDDSELPRMVQERQLAYQLFRHIVGNAVTTTAGAVLSLEAGPDGREINEVIVESLDQGIRLLTESLRLFDRQTNANVTFYRHDGNPAMYMVPEMFGFAGTSVEGLPTISGAELSRLADLFELSPHIRGFLAEAEGLLHDLRASGETLSEADVERLERRARSVIDDYNRLAASYRARTEVLAMAAAGESVTAERAETRSRVGRVVGHEVGNRLSSIEAAIYMLATGSADRADELARMRDNADRLDRFIEHFAPTPANATVFRLFLPDDLYVTPDTSNFGARIPVDAPSVAAADLMGPGGFDEIHLPLTQIADAFRDIARRIEAAGGQLSAAEWTSIRSEMSRLNARYREVLQPFDLRTGWMREFARTAAAPQPIDFPEDAPDVRLGLPEALATQPGRPSFLTLTRQTGTVKFIWMAQPENAVRFDVTPAFGLAPGPYGDGSHLRDAAVTLSSALTMLFNPDVYIGEALSADENERTITGLGYRDADRLPRLVVLGSGEPLRPEVANFFLEPQPDGSTRLASYVDQDLLMEVITLIGNKHAEDVNLIRFVGDYLKSIYDLSSTDDLRRMVGRTNLVDNFRRF
ncbi:MAG: hypothetical protein JO102_03210, partial [Elusimicrobia bacterium]|nr:hypothetical protein [Elusimicrobiota bacterium]